MRQNSKKDRIQSLPVNSYYTGAIELFIPSPNRFVSQLALVVKNLLTSARDIGHGFNPWVGRIPWRKAWQPTPEFFSGESHGQRSLASYSS